jgi:hypothetical protein
MTTFRGGKRVGTIAADAPFQVFPAPTGEHVVVVDPASVALVTPEGARRWTRAIAGAYTVVWLDDGALAIATTAGIARLDASTGGVTATRCGWRFGESSHPHPGVAQVEPLCGQLQ